MAKMVTSNATTKRNVYCLGDKHDSCELVTSTVLMEDHHDVISMTFGNEQELFTIKIFGRMTVIETLKAAFDKAVASGRPPF